MLFAFLVSSSFANFLAVAISFANFSSSNATNLSPANGTSSIPMTETGVAGRAESMIWFKSFVILLILPYVVPTTMKSPVLKLPFWTSKVAFGPSLLSWL